MKARARLLLLAAVLAATAIAVIPWARAQTVTTLNARATALGPTLNVFGSASSLVPTPPAYERFEPARFLRPFDLAAAHAHSDHGKAA